MPADRTKVGVVVPSSHTTVEREFEPPVVSSDAAMLWDALGAADAVGAAATAVPGRLGEITGR
ncbi:hypothetical protein [Halorubellus salinus]|uniref:hypothetical protein n=1 Tax=Halorubellus salinus TaxID=755309 RepID=UPI001D08CAAE|nr:hypothetical protein [Halorubellus salinus]